MLADAGGEHQRVDAAERRRERAQLLGDVVDRTVRPPRRARVGLASRSRMSFETPETPSSPDCLYRVRSIALASMFSACIQVEQDPGSIAPVRVPSASRRGQ